MDGSVRTLGASDAVAVPGVRGLTRSDQTRSYYYKGTNTTRSPDGQVMGTGRVPCCAGCSMGPTALIIEHVHHQRRPAGRPGEHPRLQGDGLDVQGSGHGLHGRAQGRALGMDGVDGHTGRCRNGLTIESTTEHRRGGGHRGHEVQERRRAPVHPEARSSPRLSRPTSNGARGVETPVAARGFFSCSSRRGPAGPAGRRNSSAGMSSLLRNAGAREDSSFSVSSPSSHQPLEARQPVLDANGLQQRPAFVIALHEELPLVRLQRLPRRSPSARSRTPESPSRAGTPRGCRGTARPCPARRCAAPAPLRAASGDLASS